MSVDVRAVDPFRLGLGEDPRRAVADGLVDTASRLIRLVARERVGAGTLSTSQVLVLALLDELGPTRISRLADYERCSQPAMTALVARLEAQGLVTRRSDESDRRAVLVSVTSYGLSRLDESRDALRVRIMAILDDLTAEQQRRLGRAVTEIQSLLGLSGGPSAGIGDRNHVSGSGPDA
ncbi:MarR family winged helix-turn-helix transcriptional regulator [Fodinicola acaciae]|uniref:MarR family winged helix-turn-helix transcriptional regulator n=1 Tax=Fodinicola acaciae TaxID=2681555 RepID=UPI0013D4D4AB|nr:MarR family transcriptional regulator [Fodinicola acaciae]